VIDDRHRTTLRRPALLTQRAQATVSQLTGERRIRPVEAERDDLVEQRQRPQMRVLDEAFAAVVDEHVERIDTAGATDISDSVAGQIGADRLAVAAEMTGDRRDRPASPVERVCVHIFLPCEHGTGLPRRAGGA
jgi:hypothetical protein